MHLITEQAKTRRLRQSHPKLQYPLTFSVPLLVQQQRLVTMLVVWLLISVPLFTKNVSKDATKTTFISLICCG